MTKVLYPGSFDPITNGHTNIVNQASELFDEVIIVAIENPAKKTNLFTLEERVTMIREIYKHHHNIKVVSGQGATVDVAILHDCKAIIRGLRSLSDFDYEVQLSQINKQISNGVVNTVCLLADLNYQFVSSTMVKEVFDLGKDIKEFVDPIVYEQMLIKKRNIDSGN